LIGHSNKLSRLDWNIDEPFNHTFSFMDLKSKSELKHRIY
jgi:hypothetical protein